MKEEMHKGLPVAGYQEQTATAVAIVNENKALEERILRRLDRYRDQEVADPRWLAIARTHIEEGFMAFNRSIFKPGRVRLPGDE